MTQEHSLIKGFSGKLTQSQLTSLQGDDIIKYIGERTNVVEINALPL